MKKIEAIIKPFKIDDVREALWRVGVDGMTISEVRRLGRSRESSEPVHTGEYPVDYVTRLKLEIAVENSHVAAVVEAIIEAASSGRPADGKIFVLVLNEVVRIRTGERATGPRPIAVDGGSAPG